MKRIIGIFGLVVIAVLILIGSALGSYKSGKLQTMARTFWPEKEGVTHHLVEYGETLDSCIPANSLDVRNQSFQPC